MQTDSRPGTMIYRVRIGPLGAVDDVERMLDRVRALGIRTPTWRWTDAR
jgi:hypothetical protein